MVLEEPAGIESERSFPCRDLLYCSRHRASARVSERRAEHLPHTRPPTALSTIDGQAKDGRPLAGDIGSLNRTTWEEQGFGTVILVALPPADYFFSKNDLFVIATKSGTCLRLAYVKIPLLQPPRNDKTRAVYHCDQCKGLLL
jgi:hypothetical protein